MKLDAKGIRHLSNEDWRVLAAVEQGSRNHEVVPTTLITTLTRLRTGSAINQSISTLAKLNLIAKVRGAKYDGYRLTYGGIDYLALHTHLRNDTIYSVGNQIGVGKESDILVVASQGGRRLVLKIHRLGRISFRTVKANRDYLKNRSSASWMYMSRLAAMKEFAFMRALRDAGFPVPEPVAQDRHTVVMELIDAFPLRQISSIPDPASLYERLIDMVLDLAKFGLIHGDFNEFNILIIEKEEVRTEEHKGQDQHSEQPTSNSQLDHETPPTSAVGDTRTINNFPTQETPTAPLNPNTNTSTNISLTPILIDFPQMLSTNHPNAEYYFDRDISCVKRFFQRRFNFTSDEDGPFFKDALEAGERWRSQGGRRLDVEVEASGFSKAMAKELERYMKEIGVDGDRGDGVEHGDGDHVEELDAQEEQVANAVGGIRQTETTGNDPDSENTEMQQMSNGLTALNLHAQEDAVPDLPNANKMSAKRAESVYTSKTTSSRMTRNPAKVATGWAI